MSNKFNKVSQQLARPKVCKTPKEPDVPTIPIERMFDCNECTDGAPVCWEVNFSGVTNNACLQCENYDGTHVLTHVSGCSWQKTLSACGFANEINLFFGLRTMPSCSAGSKFRLEVRTFFNPPDPVDFPIANWETDVWACMGPNEMTLCDSDGNCNNWPSSITLTGINCP